MSWNKYFITPRKKPPVADDREPKLMKQDVGYEHPAKGPHNCGECKHFRGPHSCEIVMGHIRREDWCTRFSPKEN